MSDWNLPILTTAYDLVLDYLKGRDVDSATLCLNVPSNPPIGMMRYVRATDKFQEWDGSVWNDKVIAIVGGGTGGTTQIAARAGLGLGDMSIQSSAAVVITGGIIAGNGVGLTTLNGNNIASGTVPTARLGTGAATAGSFLRGDQTWAALTTYLPYAAVQAADFVAAPEIIYPLSGSHIMILPTVVGIGGQRVGTVMLGTGAWTFNTNGAETILGATTFSFNFGQYASLTLIANANNSGWDIF